MRRTMRCLAASGLAALALMATSAPVVAAPDTDPQPRTGYTVLCQGGGKTANFSYTQGSVNTRVYYNNHCSHTVRVTVHLFDGVGDWTDCLKAPAGKKSSQEFGHGLSGGLEKLTRGC